jgi:hypothetical protein
VFFFGWRSSRHLRREESEEELWGSLGLDKGEIDFQLSSRSISVPIKEGDASRSSFQAIVIETSTKLAYTMRERFFELAPIYSIPRISIYQSLPICTFASI